MPSPLTGIEPLVPILNTPRPGIFSDIDGTLARITPRPADARIEPGCARSLAGLIKRGIAVGLITGRDEASARSVADVPGAAFATNHGLFLNVAGTSEPAPGVDEYEKIARAVLRQLSLRDDWLVVEDKGPVLAFHYRLAPDPESARKRLLEALRSVPDAARFRVQEGRRVVELFPDLEVNKGTAVRELAARLRLTGVVCLGDDVTDVRMFEASRRLGVPATAVAVLSEEATDAVLAAADWTVDGVGAVERLLEWMLTLASERPPSGP